jgi:hypothetical protein
VERVLWVEITVYELSEKGRLTWLHGFDPRNLAIWWTRMAEWS